jgi:pimeloyl-ACP methyl ester carboxylesterase
VNGPDTAQPVVLLNALFATATSWGPTVAGLAQHYRTYAVDVMGEANKSRPSRPIASMDDYAQWFTEVLDGLGLKDVVLIGNSFGGFGGAYCAMQLGQRIRNLVLIGPAATFHSMTPFYLHTFLPKALYLLLPWLPGREWVMRRGVNWLLAGLPTDPAWVSLFTQIMVHGSMTTRVFPRVYKPEELAQITAPALLIVGDHERIYSPEAVSSAARRLMPSVQVAVIPDAHHITALAQPERVNQVVTGFIDKAGVTPILESQAIAATSELESVGRGA